MRLALAAALTQERRCCRGAAPHGGGALADWHRIIQRARHLGAYLQATRNTDEERAHSERHSTAEAVIAETAVLDFMRREC